MQFKRLLIIFICLVLGACATVHTAEYLREGKNDFKAGKFQAAFHELLPVAYKGDKEAQYAVGYMYFYGYGVEQDSASAVFWIRRSADQCYLPAINALEDINRKKRQIADNQPVEKTQPFLVTNPPDEKKTLAYEKSLTDVFWPDSPEKKHYTLQLFGSYHLDQVQKLQAKLNLQGSSSIQKMSRDERDWYVLTYGKYTALDQAHLAKNTLPEPLKTLNPWVRKL